MSPDLNSLPSSPRRPEQNATLTAQSSSVTHSRRTSTTMAPPPVPYTPSSPTSTRTQPAMTDNTGVGVGPGPLRHPRPMTPAELHLELEKEQEGIVNRLTRELSLLRQQTASVASTTSSTSELLSDYSGIVPTPARRHRSSSNLSTRSTRSINATTANATSVSGVAPARETSVQTSSRPSMDLVRPDLSRQNSSTGRRSITASPSMSSSQTHNAFAQSYQAQPNRHSLASQPSAGPGPAVESHAHHARSSSFSAAIAQARYEEAAFHRAELDAVKRENDMLRQRIRDLERSVRSSSGDRSRAARSQNTSAIE